MGLKLIFMGTPEFSNRALKALIESPHQVAAVWTQPPRKAGRGQSARRAPVHDLARKHNITVHTPKTLRDKALTNPVRLRTPGRRRASFLYHLAVCGCVAEAAARAQIGRSTLYRWRDDLPRFAERWDEAIARRQRVVGDDIVLLASQIEFQPVLFAGKTVGQRRKINAQLLMHVQKRLDADRRRAEDRAERRELALLRATPVDEEALAERLLVLMERRRETSHPVSHEAAPETSDSANINKDLDEAA